MIQSAYTLTSARGDNYRVRDNSNQQGLISRSARISGNNPNLTPETPLDSIFRRKYSAREDGLRQFLEDCGTD
jgi:hypothetical protein